MAKHTRCVHHVHAFLLILVHTCLAASTSRLRCPADQTAALLRLKRSFQDPLLLPSWHARKDCCQWEGVSCDAGNASGALVAALNLSSKGLESPGGLDGALFQLSSLRHLNLAGNDFGGASLPASGFEQLTELTHLNLSNAGFAGQIPAGFGSLTKLMSLDLSYNQGYTSGLFGAIPEYFADFRSLAILQLSNNNFNGLFPRGIFQLKNLRVLDLSSNPMLSGVLPTDLPARSSLEVLRLSETKFSGAIPSSISNLKHLNTLDIRDSTGRFSGGLPVSISDIKSLSFLDLSNSGLQIGVLPDAIGRLQPLSTLRLRDCGISGAIPSSIENLTRLSELDLSQNNLTGVIPMYNKRAFLNLENLQLCCNSLSGPIPGFLFSLPRLEFVSLMSNNLAGKIQEFSDPSTSLASIYLNYNQLNGTIPNSFFRLMSLETLDLSRNGLTGAVHLSLFWRLTNLSNLCLSANKLTVIVDDEEYNTSLSPSIPPINSLGLACCNMTKIPSILKYVVVGDLDLSCNQIGGSVPKWIWASQNEDIDVFKLNLSRNMFTGMELPLANANVYYLDLSFNNLPGSIPIPMSPQFLDYSNNRFSSIPRDLIPRLNSSFYLNMANNTLRGSIPPMICNASSLQLLDLSYNNFSGRVPSCLVDGRLTILKLRYNQFEGTLPDGIQGRCVSQTIDLNGNQMEGQLPRSLSKCNDLEVFDVGGNNFVDSFPTWLGNLTKLRVLVLRSNKLSGPVGEIPANFSSLQILDLALNNFSGSLHPQWFENLTAMMVAEKSIDARQALENNLAGKFYRDTVVVTYKGTTRSFGRILVAFTVIDFSANAFTGSIPELIGGLASLRGLNMSHNSLTGMIPPQLGRLTQLESLDLSSNQLHGVIPEALTSLTSLAWLNVSSNQLEGTIPQRGQFLTFTADSFQGNAGLCGMPLPKQCDPRVHSSEQDDNSKDRVGTIVLYLVVGSGYGLGFAMAILFQLLCKGKRWGWNSRMIISTSGRHCCS
ncbi:receptor like protein 42 [Brachypodium distachyon]|uniref:Leucine-rich repeat-containing N-terminal plant-type domain-containing protein n=1 Tax=Brachypodium distachyon TaxID=15368 RepID=I1IZ69_BRADI|nr:receptor like protein 42 [Brachypodium distachyon]KQJ83328.1 hypothetical protein BRADI_5g14330v3 [Brachypodium distachyon]|eukprot:XP_003581380.1 receptor like protein 42 [Brachypodium distachyon]